jgi:hypothetical protein
VLKSSVLGKLKGLRKSSSKSDRKHYILSYGGGVNSFALLLYLIKESRRIDEVVFADTGAELPETYSHIRFVRSFLKKIEIPFTTVKSNNGTLYETCRRRKVIPSMIWRWSTRDYKITPIYAYYRSLGKQVNQYLALTYDEIERMKDSGASYVNNLFPLIDERINREGCLKLIQEHGYRAPGKSGCFFCPFNSVNRWHEIYVNHRDLFWKAVRLEEGTKHFPKQRLNRLTLRGLASDFKGGVLPELKQIETPCGAECLT